MPWWDVFKDETLKGLIQTSLANNYDLAAAVTRVEQARQVAAEARSQYFPAISYSTAISAGQNQFTTSPASNGNGVQGFFLGIALATWEPDLWGRIRRMNESARAQYLATEEGRRGVMLTLVSDVSQAYFELLGLKLQLDIARAERGNLRREPEAVHSAAGGRNCLEAGHVARRGRGSHRRGQYTGGRAAYCAEGKPD